MPTRSSRESGMSTKFPEITSSRTRRVLRAGQAGNMSRMPSRSLKASSTSQPPSETGSRVSLFTIPPPTSPEDARVVAIAAARAHADLSRAAAAADPTPSRPGPGADGAAPSTCSTLSMPTPEKTPREYQSAIASKCERENTLVVLPTGAGKTMVAAEVIKRHPPRAVFLVPTKILAEQQARALRGWTGLHVVSFKGGDELPRTTFDVLVATAGAFVASQKKQLPLFQWSLFRVVIFDEVHKLRKKHPYLELARSLSSSSFPPSHPRPRVVGLTASFSYDESAAEIKDAMTKLCRYLRITNTATATFEQLEAGGYTAMGMKADVRPFPATATPLGVLPEADRKNEQATAFFHREAKGSGTRFAAHIMACIRSMEKAAAEEEKRSTPQAIPPFTSPMPPCGNLNLGDWGSYAHNLAHGGAASRRRAGRGRQSHRRRQRDLVSSTACLQLAELEHWYEALKVLIVSWEEREDEAATILDMFACTGSPSYRASEKQRDIWPTHVLQKISAFWAGTPDTFPRYEHLKDVLLEKYKHHGGDGGGRSDGRSFGGILFVRGRITTHVLAHVIARDPRLGPLLSTACLYASSSPATASLAISEREATERIQYFREGRVNLLVATAVAEEGMDIPDANCVVCYDSVETIVSFVQRRGRARAKDSSFVVLSERMGRTAEYLEAVEDRQRECLLGFKSPHSNSPAGEVAGSDQSEFDEAASMRSEAEEDDGLPEPRFASMIGRSLYSELNGSDGGIDTDPDKSIVGMSQQLSASTDGGDVHDVDWSEAGTASGIATDDADVAAQWLLERAARSVLLDVQDRHGLDVVMSAQGTPIPPPGVLSAVTDFAAQTNTVLGEMFRQHPANRLWVCTLSYESPLRRLSASGEAVSGKKTARKLAAARLVADLIESTDPARTCSAGVDTDEEGSADNTWFEPDESIAEMSEQASASTDGGDMYDDVDWSEAGTECGIATDVDQSAAQRLLERAARSVLLDVQDRHGLDVVMSAQGTPFPPPGVLSAVTDFAAQTNTVLGEMFRQHPANRLWVCTLSYESPLRQLSASGEAVSGKKAARKLAAARLVAQLLAVVPADGG